MPINVIGQCHGYTWSRATTKVGRLRLALPANREMVMDLPPMNGRSVDRLDTDHLNGVD
jgi:hypothetical protein